MPIAAAAAACAPLILTHTGEVTLVAYVLATAALVVLWGLISSWFPRLGLVANGAALIYLIRSVVSWRFEGDLATLGRVLGFGWATLLFITVLFGLFAALGGLIEDRRRAAVDSELPRARTLHGRPSPGARN